MHSFITLQLALKHRQNGMQRQRIIAFVCSPIDEDEKSLIKLARKMKKGAVSIDFIAFGDMDPDTLKKLEAFNEAVKGGDGSHLAIIPPGPNLLSDSILETEILSGDGMGLPTGAGGDGDANDDYAFGVDPSADPELAMALRMSLEDEKVRQDKEKRDKEAKEGKASLEGIAEENGTSESQPLLNKDGEASGSADKKDKDDDDKMDTA